MKYLIVIFTAFIFVNCKTTSSESKVQSSSASRDIRTLETALSNYTFELKSFSAFVDNLDYSNYYEDIDTKKRTNFVIFSNADSQCTVGLTVGDMELLKSAPNTKFTARTNPPGRSGSLHQSQIFFGFTNEKTKVTSEFLVSCAQPNRRLTISDVSENLGSFIRFKSGSADTPKYDVCCKCSVDIYRVATNTTEEVIIKGDLNYYLMNDSTDAVCSTLVGNTKHPLRPGDRYFRVEQARFSQFVFCESSAADFCAAQIKQKEDDAKNRSARNDVPEEGKK